MRAAALVAFAALAIADALAADGGQSQDLCAMPIPQHDFYDSVHWCVPNAKFYNNCNFCRCNANGKAAACTDMVCPPRDKKRIDYFHEMKPKGHRPLCEPLTGFVGDFCNRCSCAEDGTVAGCTNINCRLFLMTSECSDLVVHPHHDFFDETGECIPGATFLNHCRVCQCSENGRSAICDVGYKCDRKNNRIDGFLGFKLKCPPGRKFTIDECNECTCNADGVATCTDKPCDRALLNRVSEKMYAYFVSRS